MAKRHYTATIDEELVKEMEKMRDKTGIPLSTQIVLALKGYKIVKIRCENIND